jgi:predicted nucleotidyltransferase
VNAFLDARILEVWRARSDVVAACLFGSSARGDAQPRSDVDIAVLFDTRPAATLSGPRFVIEGELERGLGRLSISSSSTMPRWTSGRACFATAVC